MADVIPVLSNIQLLVGWCRSVGLLKLDPPFLRSSTLFGKRTTSSDESGKIKSIRYTGLYKEARHGTSYRFAETRLGLKHASGKTVPFKSIGRATLFMCVREMSKKAIESLWFLVLNFTHLWILYAWIQQS